MKLHPEGLRDEVEIAQADFDFSSLHLGDGVEENNISLAVFSAKESNGGKFVFSPDGKHVIYYGSDITGGQFASLSNAGWHIDGKFIPNTTGYMPSNPTFTPDGRHLF